MFDDLRRAFKEAVDNFHQELGRDSASDAVADLLQQMEREAVEAKASVAAAREQLEKARSRAKKEAEEEAVCRRRERLAREIGDAETAQIAARYGAKHAEHGQVLARKAEAVEAEIRLGTAEYENMVAKIKEARARQHALAATAGRAKARDSLGGVSDLLDDLDRRGEDMARERAGPSAADFDEALSKSREDVIDERLEALKRRMGRK